MCNKGTADILIFLFGKPGYMPSLRGHIYCQSPAKIPVQIQTGKCENVAGLGMESKAPRFHGTARTMLR